MYVVGVDGCPSGWLAIIWDIASREITPQIHASFEDLVATYHDAAAIAIDIPIGLAEGVPRQCDVEARKLLGPRRSSVFPAPDPRFIDIADYAEALRQSREITGKGISRQAFAIYPKVAEVNAVVSPFTQDRVFEIHPEVSFWALAGRQPMSFPKRTPQGFDERRVLLSNALHGVSIPARQDARRLAKPATADDVLDAIVAAWTAHRHAHGLSDRLPVMPPTDAYGLRMEMVY